MKQGIINNTFTFLLTGLKILSLVLLLGSQQNVFAKKKTPPLFFQLSCEKIADATNGNTADGVAKMEISNLSPPTIFRLVNSQGDEIFEYGNSISTITINQDKLPAETYTLTVSDQISNQNCTFMIGVKTCGTLAVQSSNASLSCHGDLANLSAIATGEFPPFTFKWNTGLEGAALNNVPAGSYSVTITDKVGCTASTNATIIEPALLQVFSNPTKSTTSTSADGKVDLNWNGGIGTYHLSVLTADNVPVYTKPITGNNIMILDLAIGDYQVQLKDANDCESFNQFSIEVQNCDLAATLNDVTLNCANGLTDLTITATGILSPVTYQWVHGPTTPTISSVGLGTYQVLVTDGSGVSCQVQKTVEVNAAFNPISMDFNIIQRAMDYSASDGRISLIINGGKSPYQLTIDNADGNSVIKNLTVGAFTQLTSFASGQFTSTITDANNCVYVKDFQIKVVNCLLNITMKDVIGELKQCGGTETILRPTPENAVYPLSYSWDDGVSTDFHDNLITGIYRVTATDAAGCQSDTFAKANISDCSIPTMSEWGLLIFGLLILNLGLMLVLRMEWV